MMRFALFSIIYLAGLAATAPQDSGRRQGDPNNPYDYNTVGDYLQSIIEANPDGLLGCVVMAGLVGIATGRIPPTIFKSPYNTHSPTKPHKGGQPPSKPPTS
jgi:hypothetical protein